MNKKGKIFIGIDEVGRGPLAGPICVGAIASEKIKILPGIKDSKKLSAKKRKEWFKIISKDFEYNYSFVSEKIIDKIGISNATKLAVEKVLQKFLFKPSMVLLDGSLFAPKNYPQKTIIKGDEKIPIISAASIVAKVKRDEKMIKFHKKFPKYHFDIHKGYGTKLHYKMVKKYGFCPLHRRSFFKHCKEK